MSDAREDREAKESAGFHTTRWSLVVSASGGERGPEALEWLCKAYWSPLYSFIRRRGHSHEDALDLTQGFFASLLDGEPFANVDQSRGRFRAWMQGSLNHFLLNAHDKASAMKRGGGTPTLSIDEMADGTAWEPLDPTLTPDLEFDRRWALAVMNQALAAVEEEYSRRGASDQFDVLKPFLTARPDLGGYDSVATQLGVTPNTVAVAVKRLRERFRERVRTAVMETVGSAEDLESEMAHLFAALRGSG